MPEGPSHAATTPVVSPPAPAEARKKHITEHFNGQIEPVKAGVLYQFGLLIVAIVILLLPLAYLGLIMLVGYLVYLHAVNDTAILTDTGRHIGRGYIILIAIYVAPIIAGATMILFMVKPFFARRVKRINPYTIEPGQEPLLYSFVDAIAKAVGSPSPSIIEVDGQVNAHAAFRRGYFSFFSNDLILCIGMPLIAGMNTRELAGVLAHELGHFSQQFAMRMTYIIYRTNKWFSRIVHDRDSWDEKLWELSHSQESFWFSLIFMFARLCVWLSRKILYLFMLLAHGISCFMSRQMEFNADLHEIRLAGSEAFISASRRIHDLGAAAGYLTSQLPQASAAGRLADDFPALVENTSHHIPPHVRKAMDASMEKERTAWFATHPATRDRIDRAKKENAPGIFKVEQPCSKLLRNYPVLCKWTTVGYYQNMLGPRVDAAHLVPVDKVVKDHRVAAGEDQAFGRCFQGLGTPSKPIFPEPRSRHESASAKELAQRLRAARKAAEAAIPAARAVMPRLQAAEERRMHLNAARSMLASNIKASAPALKISKVTPESLAKVGPIVEQEFEAAMRDYEPFHKATVDRFSAMLALLPCKELAPKLERQDKLVKHAEQLCDGLRGLEDAHATVQALRRDTFVLMDTLNSIKDNASNEAMLTKIRGVARNIHGHLASLRSTLGSHPYPLEHSGENLTIASFALETLPPVDDMGALVERAHETPQRLGMLHFRIMGRMAMLIEKVEKVLGLPPMPEPPEDNSGKEPS